LNRSSSRRVRRSFSKRSRRRSRRCPPHGRRRHQQAGGPPSSANAREHRRRVGLYEVGRIEISEVEAAELLLLDARQRLGEIDRIAWHRARAVLLARTAERTRLGAEWGGVPFADVSRARLAVDLKWMLAGEPVADYDKRREELFVSAKAQQQSFVEVGLRPEKDAAAEIERLQAEFPTADVAKAGDR
jgi:hypothetical protein